MAARNTIRLLATTALLSNRRRNGSRRHRDAERVPVGIIAPEHILMAQRTLGGKGCESLEQVYDAEALGEELTFGFGRDRRYAGRVGMGAASKCRYTAVFTGTSTATYFRPSWFAASLSPFVYRTDSAIVAAVAGATTSATSSPAMKSISSPF